MRVVPAIVGVASILGGLALGLYDVFGWVVTSSTGVASNAQRTSTLLLLVGAAVAVAVGIGLVVFAARKT